MVAPASFSTLALRCAPPALAAEAQDRLNHRILERVNATGEAFLSHTVLAGRVAIRFTVGNLRTTADEVERAWALLQAAALDEGVLPAMPPGPP
jgi:aromatic-L-amino-acid decarboxylase